MTSKMNETFKPYMYIFYLKLMLTFFFIDHKPLNKYQTILSYIPKRQIST